MLVSPYSIDTMQIYDYYSTFLVKTYYDKIDFSTFLKTNEGYLKLKVSVYNNTKRKLDLIEINSKNYYVLSGTYLLPFCKNLVRDKNMTGMMLDMTWFVLQNYITSFPTLIAGNVGIPIGFTFSLIEDSTIYNDFFDIFEDVFSFKITDFIKVTETDQGPALKSAANSQNLTQIFCLRHFLSSLGTSEFSSQIGNIICAQCTKDYSELISTYENNWKGIKDEEKKQELSTILQKIGHDFVDGKIEIIDYDRWISISMINRPQFKMPSCTNQIESGHGHMNFNVPRRNELLSSLNRIIKEILQRNHNFNLNYTQNYKRFQRKIKNISKSTPPKIMQSQIRYYNTDLLHMKCDCGESAIMSSMLNARLPCSHLYSKGMTFPILNPPKLDMVNLFKGELFFEYSIIESKKVVITFDYYDKIRRYVYKMIKRYSHNKNKQKITNFVNEKLPFTKEPDKFLLGYPVEVFSVIDEGISYFYVSKTK